jgi:hypothetical protein
MAAAFVCMGCGTGPVSAPTIITYATTFSFAFSGPDSASSQNPPLLERGLMILTLADNEGHIHGTYSYTGDSAHSGTFAGTVAEGGAISLAQFGDPNEALGATLAFLHDNWQNCDFTQAQSTGFTGSAANGELAITGALTVPCTYTVNQQQVTLPTTMTETVGAREIAD